MGGKGRKRREKNFRAAHGGHSRLPPPPVPSSVDAVPSKLRKIMAFANSSRPGYAKASVNTEKGNQSNGSDRDKKMNLKNKLHSRFSETSREGNGGHSVIASDEDHDDDFTHNSAQEKQKKTKKRKRVTDLRFETVESGGVGSGRRERKKKRLKEKKEKHKKARSEGNEDFPGRERIKFGDIVEAPPKLLVVPKALKACQDASQERLRLKAIEAYRNRKGWKSRPGIDLAPPVMTSPAL